MYKTDDAGKSWTTVFESPPASLYYFNGISCFDAYTCSVVGEGETAEGEYLTNAFTTADGGKSWSQSHTSTDVSSMGVSFVSKSEAWMGSTGMQVCVCVCVCERERVSESVHLPFLRVN